MVTINILGDTLMLEVQEWHKLLAFKSRLEVPIANINAVYADPSTKLGWWKGFRLPGTHIPGFIGAGTFYHNGKRIFWDVSNPRNTIVIDLKDEQYSQLIVEVQNPAETVEEIQAKMTQ